MSAKLEDLLARVEKAEGPDRQLDLELKARLEQPGEWSEADIAYALSDVDGTTFPAAYTASIDAATDLVARLLPKADLATHRYPSGRSDAQIWLENFDDHNLDAYSDADAKTMPLAILAALLRALPSPAQVEE